MEDVAVDFASGRPDQSELVLTKNLHILWTEGIQRGIGIRDGHEVAVATYLGVAHGLTHPVTDTHRCKLPLQLVLIERAEAGGDKSTVAPSDHRDDLVYSLSCKIDLVIGGSKMSNPARYPVPGR